MQKKKLLIALLFAVFLVLLSHVGTRMTAAQPAFSFAAEEEKQVFLTFDDGPSTVVTNRILDVLSREKVQATFFIVSDRAETRKETLLRIAQEGHTLGVHSKTHEYAKIYASNASLLADARACAAFIASVTGKMPDVYRFPGGQGTRAQRELLEREGFRVVSWNASCGDEEIAGASADMLVRKSAESAANKRRVVLLCHDSAPHRATAEALPRIIAHFRAQGYCFCAF